MKYSNAIILALYRWVKNSNDICIPNYYHKSYEMDLFRLTDSGLVVEYEVKTSKSDFKADFKKQRTYTETSKHADIISGKRCNRFYYVVPKGLISVDDIPEYAGLIYYEPSLIGGRGYAHLQDIKAAPLIHKEKFDERLYRAMCIKLANRDLAHAGVKWEGISRKQKDETMRSFLKKHSKPITN